MSNALKNINVEELDCCPHCGSEQYMTKEYTKGDTFCQFNFGESEAVNTDLYAHLTTTLKSKYYYCSHCEKRLAKIPEDKLY